MTENAPESGKISLAGFNIAPAYSFVAYVFLNGRTDNLRYALQKEESKATVRNKSYISSLEARFNSFDPESDRPDLIILDNSSNAVLSDEAMTVKRVISEPVKRFSVFNPEQRLKNRSITYIVAERIN